MANCTYIDGIASSQAIDTAGEIVDIVGLDCSSLIGAAFNWEHKSDIPAQIVGKILELKKIFSEQDCETDRQRYYWNKVNIPFLYVLGRLFDDKKESSRELAALFMDDAEHPNEKPMIGFSVEGSKIPGAIEGMVIKRSIARKVTVTAMPANKTCVAEMIPAQGSASSKNDIDSLFKGEIQSFNPNSNYLEFLQKKEEDMNKSVNIKGWTPNSAKHSQLGTIHSFSHPDHGMVTIHQNPSTKNFEVRHAASKAGIKGNKGIFPTHAEAMGHAGKYISALSGNKVLGRNTVNMPSNPADQKLGKSLEAGSGMIAPSHLVGGAALAKEDIAKGSLGDGGQLSVAGSSVVSGKVKGKKAQNPSSMVGIGVSSMSIGGAGGFGGFSKKEKSKWLARAEEEYAKWEKKEDFINFMKKSMPHMTKGEIQAFGQVLALRKAINAEKSLEKMFSSYFNKDEIPTSQNETNEVRKTTDIMMASEKKAK